MTDCALIGVLKATWPVF